MSTCWDHTLHDISTNHVNKLKKTITLEFNHEKSISPTERVHEAHESFEESVCSNDLVHVERNIHNRKGE